ncbi:hypothetical protein K8353_27770 [Burkholderia contaminans]|nr:hypothetical protein [Burkholderia contaminans]
MNDEIFKKLELAREKDSKATYLEGPGMDLSTSPYHTDLEAKNLRSEAERLRNDAQTTLQRELQDSIHETGRKSQAALDAQRERAQAERDRQFDASVTSLADGIQRNLKRQVDEKLALYYEAANRPEHDIDYYLAAATNANSRAEADNLRSLVATDALKALVQRYNKRICLWADVWDPDHQRYERKVSLPLQEVSPFNNRPIIVNGLTGNPNIFKPDLATNSNLWKQYVLTPFQPITSIQFHNKFSLDASKERLNLEVPVLAFFKDQNLPDLQGARAKYALELVSQYEHNRQTNSRASEIFAYSILATYYGISILGLPHAQIVHEYETLVQQRLCGDPKNWVNESQLSDIPALDLEREVTWTIGIQNLADKFKFDSKTSNAQREKAKVRSEEFRVRHGYPNVGDQAHLLPKTQPTGFWQRLLGSNSTSSTPPLKKYGTKFARDKIEIENRTEMNRIVDTYWDENHVLEVNGKQWHPTSLLETRLNEQRAKHAARLLDEWRQGNIE